MDFDPIEMSFMCCSYLIEEWNYMNQEVSPSDLPIADHIWKKLPCKIDEKKIEVKFCVKCIEFFCCYCYLHGNKFVNFDLYVALWLPH